MENKRSRIYLVLIGIMFSLISICCAFKPQTTLAVFAKGENELVAVHVIDVGQGDATFVELPDGQTMLIDAGDTDKGETVVNYIRGLGYNKLDYVVLTHSDSDHVGGMPKVFEAFEIKNVFRPFVLSVKDDIGVDPLAGLYTDAEIYTVTTRIYAQFIKAVYAETYSGEPANVFVSYDGKTLASTDASKMYSIEFHAPIVSSNVPISATAKTTGYPTKRYTGSDAHVKNSVSAVFSLLVDGTSKFLFTGDVTEEAERDFLGVMSDNEKALISNVDFLKVAHHGSKTASSKEFLEVVKPHFASISVKAGNSYGLPDEVVIDRLNTYLSGNGAGIVRTDESGNIVFTLDSNHNLICNVNVTPATPKTNTVPSWVYYALIAVVVLIIIICIVVDYKRRKRVTKKSVKRAKRTYKKGKKIAKAVSDYAEKQK